MRGNRCRAHRPGDPVRSIPARAGEPRTGRWRGSLRTVYPRACGGTSAAADRSRSAVSVYPRACGGTRPISATSVPPSGLSPRVRGNPRPWLDPGGHARSIPARAGEPVAKFTAECPARVYPRACGGTAGTWLSARGQEGLSPRVRGNRAGRQAGGDHPGSIPARAGEPRLTRQWLPKSGVYPRACGGTSPVTCTVVARMGLSPRVRGNRVPAD